MFTSIKINLLKMYVMIQKVVKFTSINMNLVKMHSDFQAKMVDYFTYSIAQQPLKSFDRPLMRVSLSNSILVTVMFY